MAFDPNSRYRFAVSFLDSRQEPDRTTFLGTRDPIGYSDHRDNTPYVVREGDTLEHLAARFFPGFTDSASLYWALAEYQPEPILDPTLRLRPGSVLLIPSASHLLTLIGSPKEQQAV